MVVVRLRLGLPEPFDLRLAAFGHGWIDLEPNRWIPAQRCLSTALALGKTAVDVSIQQTPRGLSLAVSSRVRLTSRQRAHVVKAVRRMLRLDEDFGALYGMCRRSPAFRWVARRGAGRLLRAPTLFEDLAKLLLTTNCSWSQTRSMSLRLSETFGRCTPSGVHCFPDPKAIASLSVEQLKAQGRLGYRAGALLELAKRFAPRNADEALEGLVGDEQALREALLSLRGFGPYAVGQALRLLGHYEDYALDAWCRNKFKERGQVCSERALARRYGRFEQYRGLMLWLDLTAPWHGEGPYATEGLGPLQAGK